MQALAGGSGSQVCVWEALLDYVYFWFQAVLIFLDLPQCEQAVLVHRSGCCGRPCSICHPSPDPISQNCEPKETFSFLFLGVLSQH